MAVTEQTIQTLEIVKEEEIAAPIDVVFETILEQMGPYNEVPERGPMPMVLEAWPGGRWFRDLGSNRGHWWGHVQAIKPPTLLEICGPLFMSYPATSNLQYRLSEENGVTRLRFVHRAIGWTQADITEGVQHGWMNMLGRIRERSVRGVSSATQLAGRPNAAAEEFAPLRMEEHHGMSVAGLKGHFLTGGDPAIPGQWTRFAAYLGKIARQVGHSRYGIGWTEPAGGLDYMSAVEVREGAAAVPGELTSERIPEAFYAVFVHAGHVSEIPKTMQRAVAWLMKNGRQIRQRAGAPSLIECYGEGFDPKSGKGDVELWIPIEK